MKTIEIAAGITATLTSETAAQYERELREAEVERELREYLATLNPSDDVYSDVYKDVYGVRPRW